MLSLHRASRRRRTGYPPTVDVLEDRIVLNSSMNTASIAAQVNQTAFLVRSIQERVASVGSWASENRTLVKSASVMAISNLNANATTAVSALQLDQAQLNSNYTQALASDEQARQSTISQLQSNLASSLSTLEGLFAGLTPAQQAAQSRSFQNLEAQQIGSTISTIIGFEVYYDGQEQALATDYVRENQHIAEALSEAQAAAQQSSSLLSRLEALSQINFRSLLPTIPDLTPVLPITR